MPIIPILMFAGPVMVKAGKGLIDPAPLWDEEGRAYLSHAFADVLRGVLRLYSVKVPDNHTSLWQQPKLLLQKFPAPEFKATTKVTFSPDPRYKGERTGLVLMQSSCKNANKGGKEVLHDSLIVDNRTLYLRVEVTKGALCKFSYSTDNETFTTLVGPEFKANTGQWIGAKVGFFITRPILSNDGGWLDIDWIRIEK